MTATGLFVLILGSHYGNSGVSTLLCFKLCCHIIITPGIDPYQEWLNSLKVVGAQLTNKTHFYCEKLIFYEHL